MPDAQWCPLVPVADMLDVPFSHSGHKDLSLAQKAYLTLVKTQNKTTRRARGCERTSISDKLGTRMVWIDKGDGIKIKVVLSTLSRTHYPKNTEAVCVFQLGREEQTRHSVILWPIHCSEFARPDWMCVFIASHYNNKHPFVDICT